MGSLLDRLGQRPVSPKRTPVRPACRRQFSRRNRSYSTGCRAHVSRRLVRQLVSQIGTAMSVRNVESDGVPVSGNPWQRRSPGGNKRTSAHSIVW